MPLQEGRKDFLNLETMQIGKQTASLYNHAVLIHCTSVLIFRERGKTNVTKSNPSQFSTTKLLYAIRFRQPQ